MTKLQLSEDEILDAALAALDAGDPQPVLDAAASGILPTDAPVVLEAWELVAKLDRRDEIAVEREQALSFCQCIRPRTWFPTDRACTRGCGLPFAS